MKKHSHTQETLQLQQQLRSLLNEVGWSLKKLAFEIAIQDEVGERLDKDPDKEYEKLRKALNRTTTKPQTLNEYINFIIEQNKKRNLYRVPKLSNDNFSEIELALFHDIENISAETFDNRTFNV